MSTRPRISSRRGVVLRRFFLPPTCFALIPHLLCINTSLENLGVVVYESSAVTCVYSVCSEDLDRKMDHKRQQIQSGVQEIRQLEQRVNQLRDEKVCESHSM